MLQRHFGEGKAKHVVLIDEAHNLVDRSREMYSSTLTIHDLTVATGTREGKTSGRVRRALGTARDQLEILMRGAPTGVPQPKPYHKGAFAAESIPDSLIDALRSLAGMLEAFLVEQSSREAALPWLEPYFVIHRFLQVSDVFDETYRMIIDPGSQSVTLFCVDPSKRLAQTLKGLRSAVFFLRHAFADGLFRRCAGRIGGVGERFLRISLPFGSNGSPHCAAQRLLSGAGPFDGFCC